MIACTAARAAARERFERNHGPNPESAYRRGLALRQLGRKDDAARALAEVGDLAGKTVGFQKKGVWTWVLRAQLARIR